MIRVDDGAGLLGRERWYKAAPASSPDPDGAAAVPFTNESERLRPLAPVQLRLLRDPATGDLRLVWERRARGHVGRTDRAPLALAEEEVRWAVRYYDPDGSRLWEDYPAPGDLHFDYLAYWQQYDFGTLVTGGTFGVVQRSPAFGEGAEARAALTVSGTYEVTDGR